MGGYYRTRPIFHHNIDIFPLILPRQLVAFDLNGPLQCVHYLRHSLAERTYLPHSDGRVSDEKKQTNQAEGINIWSPDSDSKWQ